MCLLSSIFVWCVCLKYYLYVKYHYILLYITVIEFSNKSLVYCILCFIFWKLYILSDPKSGKMIWCGSVLFKQHNSNHREKIILLAMYDWKCMLFSICTENLKKENSSILISHEYSNLVMVNSTLQKNSFEIKPIKINNQVQGRRY